jgi:DNA-binding SARP family transcriptional activator/streptogramin lyase
VTPGGHEFCVLGPLEVWLGDAPLSVPGRRQRSLLALLLIHANEHVSTGRIIDELWNEQPPPTAQASLRVAIAKLRRSLSDEQRETLRTVPGGYLLTIEDDALDAARFESLLDRAQREPACDAIRTLNKALASWRGAAFDALDDLAFVAAEASRLDERRLWARAECARLQLELGQHEHAVRDLTSLVDEHPYREPPRALLMLALYRSGRQTDALEVYRHGRTLLNDDLGLEPGDELRRLERAILEHDLAIAAPTVPTRQIEKVRSERSMPPRRAVTAALVVLALAAAATTAVDWRTGGALPAAAAVPTNSLTLISSEAQTLKRVPLTSPPSSVALIHNKLWVLDARDRTVTLLDAVTGHALRTIGLGVTPTVVATHGHAVWLLSPDAEALVRLDEASELLATTREPLPPAPDLAIGSPVTLTTDAHSVWIEDGISALLRIDPETGKATRRIVLRRGIDGLAAGAGSLWVTVGPTASVLRVDPASGRVLARIALRSPRAHDDPFPISVAFGSGAVWVLNANTGTVNRIDPHRNAITATVPRVSLDPTEIAADEGAVWVADNENDAVVRINPITARVDKRVAVGGRPASLAAARDNVWVAVDNP